MSAIHYLFVNMCTFVMNVIIFHRYTKVNPSSPCLVVMICNKTL